MADEGNSCDPWSPNDCPDGEKCAAWAAGDTWDSNKCVPINGTGVTGDECTYDGATLGTDTCDSGYMCYYTTDGVGSCIPLCTGSAEDPQCPDNFNCSISNDGSLLLCLPSCDPLLQDCSIEGTACYFDGELFNCDPAGEIAENSECGYINDCFPGGICLDASVFPDCSGAACCGAYCDLDDPTCSLDGTECVAFWEEGEAPPGQENLGLCILPG
ncbi:ribulose phosphate epimerase [Pseudenhygromyxa sp. WMMC2535]|nr:ribulose phosphate epimerase [Pseudenhygromyxa sp. WMMC2535]